MEVNDGMDIEVALSGMWAALGIVSGFFYQVKRRVVLTGIVGSCGIYSASVLAGVSFPQLNVYLNGIINWVRALGWGGLGYPIGFIVGERVGRSWEP